MPSTHRILLLDDDVDLLDRYRKALETLPTRPEIVTCTSGAKALALLESSPVALMVSDFEMPGMDGLQVFSIVRRRFPKLRYVVMMPTSDPAMRSRAYSAGVDLVWEKPASEEEFSLFQSCIEGLVDNFGGGFRGIQHKSLVDLVQLECLSNSSSVLKLEHGTNSGRIWINSGEVVDAEVTDLSGEPAFAELMSWKAGNFEILPAEPDRVRTIDVSWQALLLDSVQAQDEQRAEVSAFDGDGMQKSAEHAPSRLTEFETASGVEFLLSGALPMNTNLAASKSAKEGAPGSDTAVFQWAQRTWGNLEVVGRKLGLGPLRQVEGLGLQRHVGLSAVEQNLVCLGLNRSLSPAEVREKTRQLSVA